MGEIRMRNFDFWESRVWVNLRFPMKQVRLPIWWVRTSIRGLLNPMMQVVPLISHIRSYPPYRSRVILIPKFLFLVHNSTIIAEHKVKLSFCISPCHDYKLTLSTAYTKYSIHRVQHTPSTAYTECSIHWVQHTPRIGYTEYSIHQAKHPPKIVCRPFGLTIMSWPRNVASRFWHAFLSDRPPPASCPWGLKSKVILLHSHGCELTNWWIEHQYQAWHPLTAFKLARLWPPRASPNLLDYSLQVHLSYAILASKCISILARSRPPGASPYLLDHRLQVRMIMASKFVSELPDFGLQVHLQTLSITASKYASLCSHDNNLQAYLWGHSIIIFWPTSNCSQAPPAAGPDIPCVNG